MTDPLATVRDKAQRFYLRMYLRSNMESDQDIAKERCAKFGIDYTAAYQAVRKERI